HAHHEPEASNAAMVPDGHGAKAGDRRLVEERQRGARGTEDYDARARLAQAMDDEDAAVDPDSDQDRQREEVREVELEPDPRERCEKSEEPNAERHEGEQRVADPPEVEIEEHESDGQRVDRSKVESVAHPPRRLPHLDRSAGRSRVDLAERAYESLHRLLLPDVLLRIDVDEIATAVVRNETPPDRARQILGEKRLRLERAPKP